MHQNSRLRGQQMSAIYSLDILLSRFGTTQLAYLTYMQSTSCEMPGWMKHRLESRLPGEISITSDMQMTPPLWQKAKN